MKKLAVLVVCCAVFAATLAFTQAVEAAEAPAKKISLASVLDKQLLVLNKYEVAVNWWYDPAEFGEMCKRNEAGEVLKKASDMINLGKLKEADKLLDKASVLLDARDKSPSLFPYKESIPLLKPDLSKVYKATVADYQVFERFGAGLGDLSPSIWGWGDDGNYYLIMPLVNYHNKGYVDGIIYEIMSTADPSKRYVVILDPKKTIVTKNADSIIWNCVDGDKSMITTVTNAPGGGSICKVEGKAPGISFSFSTTPAFSFWYNQNVAAAVISPNSTCAGFEQPGPLNDATITLDGKTVKIVKGGGAVTEYFYFGLAPNAPDPAETKYNYRRDFSKYGNEWYTSVHTDQLDAHFVIYGKFRDGAIYYNGKYIVPTEFHIIPGIANKTFMLTAKTSEGDLVLNFNVKLHDPIYNERVAIVTGSFNGVPLTNGGCWFEHCYKAGPDAVKMEEENPAALMQ